MYSVQRHTMNLLSYRYENFASYTVSVKNCILQSGNLFLLASTYHVWIERQARMRALPSFLAVNLHSSAHSTGRTSSCAFIASAILNPPSHLRNVLIGSNNCWFLLLKSILVDCGSATVAIFSDDMAFRHRVPSPEALAFTGTSCCIPVA